MHLRTLRRESSTEVHEIPFLEFGNKDFYLLQSRPNLMGYISRTYRKGPYPTTSGGKGKRENRKFQPVKEIWNNRDLLIKSTDKGGAVVVMDAGLYYKLNLEILSDRDTYAPLKGDPIIDFQKSYNLP